MPTDLPSALASPATWLQVADLVGIFLFAVTGALAAARRGHDIVTFAFFAVTTGVGGGSVRDLLLDVPVFWVVDPRPLLACLAAALVVWLVRLPPTRWRLIDWCDALGLAIYAVVGAQKAVGVGVSPPVAAVMGVLTACFGGIIRDVLAGEPTIVVRRELYVTPAGCAAVGYLVARGLGLDAWPAGALGVLFGFGVRAGAMSFGWSLPGFRNGPPTRRGGDGLDGAP